MGAPAELAHGANGELARREYIEHGKQFERKVHEVAPGVWCHVGACLGNSTMIEGRSGRIIIDTGDCIEQAQRQQADFEPFCSKPLSALIYSHNHYIFGSRAWVPVGGEDAVEVWCHPDLTRNLLRNVGDLSPFFVRRALIQFGTFLPAEGEDAMSHQGLGPFIFELDQYTPTTGFVRPNRTTADGQAVEIDGVALQFFHCWGDTEDSLLIWLPETRTAINNIAWPAMFNICTLRGDVFRNPVELLRGLDKILELAPDHLVGVHGVPLHGRDEIRQAVLEYRDSIQYIYDQTVRGINAGLSPDELVQFVQLPAALSEGRLTGQFYGELPFHVRQIYAGLVGWFGKDTAELHRLPASEQAARTVAMSGGPERVAAAVEDALARREFAWAAQMAAWLLDGGFDTPAHRALKARALRAMGQLTTAANTRSWYLTQARELEGRVDTRVLPIRFVNANMVRQMPPATYVNFLRFMLSPALSAGRSRSVVLRFADPEHIFTLQLRHGVVQIVPGEQARADATVAMGFDAWARLVGRDVGAAALLSAGEARIEGDAGLGAEILGAVNP